MKTLYKVCKESKENLGSIKQGNKYAIIDALLCFLPFL